ncbi:hypothetical protein UK23_31105 [Lentzea aerocolonigenes]|uniref:Uncharacterized protein n=1 Tax=Lentzea aerocolonigenes TaxID=68170 RepID=A0A0F0GRH8_LENAE|nr:hypothetical protein [Lentzea aerocolonigenes]KJK43998.1 hypothetical protein UK23_31105 [Lentzea aerocolonigenes]
MTDAVDRLCALMVERRVPLDAAVELLAFLQDIAVGLEAERPGSSWEAYVSALLELAADRSVIEDVERFAEHDGITDEVVPALVTTNPSEFVERLFALFVRHNWALWDGSPESWLGYRSAFLNEAIDTGYGAFAEGLLAELDRLGHDDRVRLLQRYGVTPPTPQPRPRPAMMQQRPADERGSTAPAAASASAPPDRPLHEVLADWQVAALDVQYHFVDFIAALPMPGLEFFVHFMHGVSSEHEKRQRAGDVQNRLHAELTRWANDFTTAFNGAPHRMRPVLADAVRITNTYFPDGTAPWTILRPYLNR